MAATHAVEVFAHSVSMAGRITAGIPLDAPAGRWRAAMLATGANTFTSAATGSEVTCKSASVEKESASFVRQRHSAPTSKDGTRPQAKTPKRHTEVGDAEATEVS